jgi:stearoyl-CoA desaturase (Delta-9 desaturase)
MTEVALRARRAVLHSASMLFTQLVPLAAVLYAAVAAAVFHRYPTSLEISLLAVFFLLTMIGLEVGYHRYFAHQAFRTSRLVERVLAFLGSIAMHGGVIWWTATHRRHHARSDSPGDVHSPHVAPQEGGVYGFFFAHLGWMFDPAHLQPGEWARRVAPMYRDSYLFFLNRYYLQLSLAGVLLPGSIGWLMQGTADAAFGCMLWGGLIRVFLTNHAIYSLNSVCHMFGRRDYGAPHDESRNNGWLCLWTIGGSWHNNHHAFPRTATNRFRWWQLDIAGSVITFLEKVGLVWDVYRPSAQQIAGRRKSRHRAS